MQRAVSCVFLQCSQTGGTEVTLDSDVMTFPLVGVLVSLSNELEFAWSFPGSFDMLPLILFRMLSALEFCLIKLALEFVLEPPPTPLPLPPSPLLAPTDITLFRFIEVGVSDFNALPTMWGSVGFKGETSTERNKGAKASVSF